MDRRTKDEDVRKRRKRNTAIMAALKPPVAEGGLAVHGGGNRRDWFHGVGGRGAAFIAAHRVLRRRSPS